ncbi:MAG: hypothetical protein INF93_18735, partial [Rhodobacter sp.]|nr:hypothetical protein [Rhodobacter sp.]
LNHLATAHESIATIRHAKPPSANADLLAGSPRVRNTSIQWVGTAAYGAAAEIATAFSAARKDRLDLSVGIALGSASQIALFVAPVLVLLSYVIGPEPMALDFWPGAMIMMLIAALTASILTTGGRSAWFLGVVVLMVYAIFAVSLYILPPAT